MAQRKIIDNKPCPKCRELGRDKTGNHLMIFDDGGGYCNRCQYYAPAHETVEMVDGDYEVSQIEEVQPAPKFKLSIQDISDYPTIGIEHRCLKKGALEYYGVKTEISEAGLVSKAYFPYYVNGKLSAYKTKGYPKDFLPSIGSLKGCEFFGQHLVDTNSKRIIITEGEEDCIAAFSMMAKFRDKGDEKYRGFKVGSISLPAGSNSVKNTFSAQQNFLLKFDEILLCFDNDDPGRGAIKDAVEVLGYAKSIKIIELPSKYKDANEALEKGEEGYRDFINAYFKAKEYSPSWIIRGSDVSLDELKKPRRPGLKMKEMPHLSHILGGFREREMTIIAGAPSTGKSHYVRAIAYYLTANYDQKVGFISLETPIEQVQKQGIALHNSVPVKYLLENSELISDDDWERCHKELTSKEVYVSHFGNMSSKDVIDKMHFLVYHEKCKFIILDHLTCIFNTMRDDKTGGIDEFMGELSAFVVKTGVHLICVSHINRGTNSSASRGGEVNSENLRGSGMLEGYAWNLILLSRNIAEGSNNVKIVCTKNRTWGDTGIVCHANYIPSTGWILEETDAERREREFKESQNEQDDGNMRINSRKR